MVKKEIQVIKVNGEISVLPKMPTLEEMHEILGGYIEQVTVLDRIEDGQFIYTVMFANARSRRL